ncbi:hypothetical protein QSH57_004822 [Fusarium oxysporum f. sp. vasinfectum]|nr:hypothetical protein QSH57_004822 [Fusarium oxysporum f. sp. vasinfectum]
MNVRFVDDPERDPAVLHRRRLQANRTRNYRRRTKANRNIQATYDQAELLPETVDSESESEQTGPDAGGFRQDEPLSDGIYNAPSLSDDDPGPENIEPAYYEEEPVSAPYAEEHRESQTPECYADMQADSPDDNMWTDVQHATHLFIQQFLVGIRGCSAQEHREDLATHIEASGTHNHYGLDQLFPRDVPHTLDKEHFFTHKTSNEGLSMSVPRWQELFSGYTAQYLDGKPKQACLHTHHTNHTPPTLSFDIDSLLGFVTSPAVATHGIRFYSAPQYCQNIFTDVHLTLDRMNADPGRPRLIPSRLRDVPHFIFAKVEGADFITLHLFFPHLPCSHTFNRLTDEQFSRWFDDIFYPAIRRVYDVDQLQHLPAIYRHALATCRAPKVEDRLLETPSYRTQLRMAYFLPSRGLQALWDCILAAVRRPGLEDFRNPELFIEAKGTKLLFKYPNAPSDLLAVMENFSCKLHRVLDFSYICKDRLYIDVGKETCPLQNSVSPPEAQTYLWRRCCIRHHLDHLYDGIIPKSGQNFYHESMLRDAGGMTTLTPLRSRLRRGGILYGQMYNLTKEIIDAARTFPFQNPDLRHLALDPQLRHGMQNICGKSTSSNSITDRAYLASKRRCHYGLTDSNQRSFGVREEYRISWVLFQSVLIALRSLTPETRSIKLPGPLPYLWAIRSSVFVDFAWHNIDKFTMGFELVRAQRVLGLTTWEQTKIMDMFLRCIRVAAGGHDYSREGALWWSRRELPQPVGSPQVRYGLGFGQTLEQYGYCWLEHRINWGQLRFLPEITNMVLFGTGTLQKRYLKYGGHIKHFFDLSRCADLGLQWLQRYAAENVIINQILSWLCHICLQQMRIDIMNSVRRDLLPEARTTTLDDHVQFCREGLSAILLNDITAVSGNHSHYKSPLGVAQALFGFDDSRPRGHWENKPFRKLHQRICAALQEFPAERRLSQLFTRRLHRYLFGYYWVLPYPSSEGLAPRTKDAGAGREPVGGRGTLRLSLNISIGARINGSRGLTAIAAKGYYMDHGNFHMIRKVSRLTRCSSRAKYDGILYEALAEVAFGI